MSSAQQSRLKSCNSPNKLINFLESIQRQNLEEYRIQQVFDQIVEKLTFFKEGYDSSSSSSEEDDDDDDKHHHSHQQSLLSSTISFLSSWFMKNQTGIDICTSSYELIKFLLNNYFRFRSDEEEEEEEAEC